MVKNRMVRYPDMSDDINEAINDAYEEGYEEGYEDGYKYCQEDIMENEDGLVMRTHYLDDGSVVYVWVPTVEENVKVIQKEGKDVSISRKYGLEPRFEDQYGWFTFAGESSLKPYGGA